MNWASHSSNDDLFHPPRARYSPLKASVYHVVNTPTRIQLFRVAGDKFWRLRFFVFGRQVIRTLHCTQRAEAETMAAEICHEFLALDKPVTQAGVGGNTTPNAESAKVLQKLIGLLLEHEHARVKRDEIKQNSFLMTKTRLEGFIFEFFSNMQLSLIDVDAMESFVNHLTRQGLSGPTIKGYLTVCLKLLKLMHRQQIIQQIPPLPPVRAQYKSRGAFTLTEYRAIVRKARELRGQTFDDWGEGKRIWIKEQHQIMPESMHMLIRFMVYTFVRPGDLRQLKHKHVEIVRNKFTYLRLTMPEIKRHQAAVVSLPQAVPLYERITEMNRQAGYGRPDDPVFFPDEPDRKLALGLMGWLFNWILNDLSLKTGPHGAERSLYSLRHTAITFRLLYGGHVDLLTLAKNSRTSVEMIERFYASTLAAEANISLLHGKRRQH